MKLVTRAAALALSLVATNATAATFTLDFGSFSSSAFDDAAGNTIDYGVVTTDGVTDIYARLTTLTSFVSPDDANNGAAAGDIRVNAARGETVQLALELYTDSSYSTLYTTSVDYDWSVVFYDIDGSSTSGGEGTDAFFDADTYYDQVLVRTEGVATFAADTVLDYSVTADGLLVSAEGESGVEGQSGVTTLSSVQQQYAFVYTVSNTSTLLFDYTVQDTAFDTRERNLLIDGGDLVIEGDVLVVPVPVPLPAGAPLMLAALGAFGALRLRKKR